jgi:hypothetical protein
VSKIDRDTIQYSYGMTRIRHVVPTLWCFSYQIVLCLCNMTRLNCTKLLKKSKNIKIPNKYGYLFKNIKFINYPFHCSGLGLIMLETYTELLTYKYISII